MLPRVGDGTRRALWTTFSHGGGVPREWCVYHCWVPTLDCRAGCGKDAPLLGGVAPRGLSTAACEGPVATGRF